MKNTKELLGCSIPHCPNAGIETSGVPMCCYHLYQKIYGDKIAIALHTHEAIRYRNAAAAHIREVSLNHGHKVLAA